MEKKAALLRKRIVENYPDLSVNHKKIADFILENMREAAYLSVTGIGDRTGTSKATVVRFAQQLGFEGFIDFRNDLNQAVNAELDHLSRIPLHTDNKIEALYQVAKQDVKNINETISKTDPESFKIAIELLASSKTVYVAGLGISHLLSQILSYSLAQVSVRSQVIRHDYISFYEQAHLVTPNDCLVIFSFPPYSVESIDFGQLVAKKGIPVLGISNSLTSPVSTYSKVTLPVRSENLLYTNSIASVFVLINAIATELAILNQSDALAQMKITEDQLLQAGQIILPSSRKPGKV